VNYTITRHDDVRFDLAAILDLVGNYAGYGVGRRKVGEVEATFGQLSHFPHIGSKRDDVFPELRVIQSGEKAMVCFVVNDDARTVRIISVTYAGQDWQRIARERREAEL
jgi:toxin ParE1/3/4